MQELKTTSNHLGILLIVLFSIHSVVSNYIFNVYSLDRVLITSSVLVLFLYTLIFKYQLLKTQLWFTNTFVLFSLFAFLQYSFSSHINTYFEVEQQIFISVSYLSFTLLFLIYKNTDLSISSYLETILYLNIIIISAMVITYFIHFYDKEYSLLNAIHTYFENIRIFNHLQTIFISSLFISLSISKTKALKILTIILLSANFNLLLYTGGRGTIYAIVIAIIFLYFTSRKKIDLKNDILLFVGLFAINTVFFYTFNYLSLGSTSSHITNITLSGRALIYSTLIPLIVDPSYFLSAIGFSSQDIGVTHFLHPHNLFLYVFMGTGTIGLIVFFCLTLFYGIKTYKQYAKATDKTDKYLLVILISVLAHSFVSGVYITPLTNILILFYLLLLYTRYFKDKSLKSTNKKSITFSNTILLISVSITLAMSMKNNIYLLQHYDYVYKKTKEQSDDKVYKIYHPGVMLYSDNIFGDAKF